MKKYLLALMVTLALCLGLNIIITQAETYSGNCGTNTTYMIDVESGVMIISGIGDMMDYTASSEVPWYNIKNYIKSITIEDGITSIGDYTFGYCECLTNITIPESVISIGEKAFYKNGSLKEVIIPTGVEEIGDSAFENCISLEKAIVPGTVECIGNELFRGCISLSDIEIESGVEVICSLAFADCSSLTKITIPDSVVEIYEAAFSGCNWLTEMTLPFIGEERGISGTEESVFGHIFGYNISSTQGTVEQYYTSKYYHYYRIPANLKTVTITDETVIPYGAFYGCLNLTNINICSGVEKIMGRAFYNCRNVKSIIVPDSVKFIAAESFMACVSLDEITLPFIGGERGNDETFDSVFGYIFGYTSSTISGYTSQQYSPDSSYYYAIPSRLTKVTITDETIVPYGAFNNCVNLTNIKLCGNITGIGKYAFYGCNQLKSIVMQKSVNTIEKYAFANCENFTDVYYDGSEEEWDNIEMDATGNKMLLSATIHFSGAEDEPAIPDSEGKTPQIGKTTFTFRPVGVSKGDIIAVLVVKDGVSTAQAKTYSGSGTVTFEIEDGFDSIKILVWDSYESMEPLMEEYATIE